MLTTGLLSLNIHEALSLEGTELCLHPDLFVTESSGGASQQTRSSHANKSAVSNDDNTTTSQQSSTPASSPDVLSVGDMIEIRVWDPLPKEAAIKSPATSLSSRKKPRQSSPAATPSTVTPPSVHVEGVQVELPFPNSTAVPVQASSLNLRPRAASMANSLAYSESEKGDLLPDNNSEINDASTTASSHDKDYTSMDQEVKSAASPTAASGNGTQQEATPPTKTVITTIENSNSSNPTNTTNAGSSALSSQLPPVFPRHQRRASTSDLIGSLPPKPPSQQSSQQTHCRGPSFSGALLGSLAVSSQQQVLRSPNPIGRHDRQMSDMTMESHQPDLREIQSMESHDDDVTTCDATWSKLSTTHKIRLSFVLLVTEKTLTTLRGNTRTQISMLRQVADLYSLSSYDTVTVHKIDPQDEEEVVNMVSADFLLVTIKDQFISRGDMLFFQKAMVGSWIYEGQRLNETTRGVKAHAREIRHGNRLAKSGIVTDKTMITFRSRSSRIIWLVQLSSEMWDYTSPYEHVDRPESICEVYFDQWIRFIYKLFTKWKELEVTHSLTVVFFSRTFLSKGQKSSLNCKDVYGRSYEDHYKPVIENETCTDWESLVVKIKEEWVKYPLEVGWNLSGRLPSTASQGNVLEAINVTLNVMQFHHLDRDLYRTGNSIVVISPGCGVFEVDRGLAGITYQRMMDHGIGSDMLSLGLPPLHIAPFFLYNNEYRAVETRGVDTNETYYEVPHWMHLSFVNYDREEKQKDGHSKPENSSNTASNLLDPYEIGPNGFIRPKIDPDSLSNVKEIKSFSALGNMAATPGIAKLKHERQLISDRDFRDILEACKPRISGTRMPSALASLLILHQLAVDTEKARSTGVKLKAKKQPRAKDLPLREWGTVDFGESYTVQPKSKSNRSSSPSVRRVSQEFLEKSEGCESVGSNSNSSGFASHVSSMFSNSYDRVLWDNYESPSTVKNVVQIQRSNSIDFNQLSTSLPVPVDSDTALSEESMSLCTDTASRSSGGKGSSGMEGEWAGDNDTTASRQSKSEKHAETLRRMMEAHDITSCGILSSQVDGAEETNLVRPGSTHPSDPELNTSKSGSLSQTMRHRGKEPSQSGGLDAALSQFDGGATNQEPTTSSRMTRRHGSSNRISGQSFSTTNQYTRAASPLFPSMSQFQDRGSMAMSPNMLIAPVIQPQPQEAADSLRPDKATPVTVNRMMALDGKQHLREGHGSFGTSNFYDYGSATHQNFTSISNFEGNRQKLKPISRSPPTNTGMIRASAKLASSPTSASLMRERSTGSGTLRMGSRDRQIPTPKNAIASRRKKLCNPFRQSDEDEVLAKRSHNRRRWSHVFPAGEAEFKRHSGPIWNSLTSPAILPLSIDYFPSPQELRDESMFLFSPYTVTLGGLDKKHYSTHRELLMEMVRQRITQDFQIVTDAAVAESQNRAESQRQGRNRGGNVRSRSSDRDHFVPSLPTIKPETSGTIKHYLSMGHRIQVLEYDPSSDTIEIVHYNKKTAQNTYDYRFLLYSKVTEKYTQSIQTFTKYSEPYRWNKVDNLILQDEEDRAIEAGMKSRRVMFGLIPESFKDLSAEQEYISKFKRLVEYLGKLREKEDAKSGLEIKIISSQDEKEDKGGDVLGARHGTADSMIRFTVQLRKAGKREPFEWVEIGVDSIFDTSSSYRIMFNWLVASSTKVEAQVQLLHRRCTQFGLRLISFPQTTIAKNLFLHAFAVPTLICIKNKDRADLIDETLKKIDFVADGIHLTDSEFLKCIDDPEGFDFIKWKSGKVKTIPARQYVHRSGALFIRLIRDQKGWGILAGIENHRHASKENGFRDIAKAKLREISRATTLNRPTGAD